MHTCDMDKYNITIHVKCSYIYLKNDSYIMYFLVLLFKKYYYLKTKELIFLEVYYKNRFMYTHAICFFSIFSRYMYTKMLYIYTYIYIPGGCCFVAMIYFYNEWCLPEINELLLLLLLCVTCDYYEYCICIRYIHI